ncbi:MAG: FecR domain-containing protein [Verrucomicrobiota bacterium]
MPADYEPDPIEEMAAGWLIERDRGFTPGREQEFARWLHADARHEATYRALAATWGLLGEKQAAEVSTCDSERLLAGRRRHSGSFWGLAGLAAAALVALVFFSKQPVETSGIEPRLERVALQAQTEVGALRKVDLPDGSTIQLNTDSAVEVQFEPGVRRVKLARGEAHFTVAKDAARPFIVNAGGVDVRVVGTIFNVRLRSESVDVLVTEGRVRVGGPTAETAQQPAASTGELAELTAGQRLSVGLNQVALKETVAPVAATPAEIRQTLAWQTRRLDFDATPLGEIVTEINRYNRHQLVLGDERLKERRFGGSFPATDYATFVRMLEADFGVVAERRGGETWLRVKGNANLR